MFGQKLVGINDFEKNNSSGVLDSIENKTLTKKPSLSEDLRRRIGNFILMGLGGIPPKFRKLEITRVFNNTYRVNVVSEGKGGLLFRPHSYLIHTEPEIHTDVCSPLEKVYDNFQEIFTPSAKESI